MLTAIGAHSSALAATLSQLYEQVHLSNPHFAIAYQLAELDDGDPRLFSKLKLFLNELQVRKDPGLIAALGDSQIHSVTVTQWMEKEFSHGLLKKNAATLKLLNIPIPIWESKDARVFRYFFGRALLSSHQEGLNTRIAQSLIEVLLPERVSMYDLSKKEDNPFWVETLVAREVLADSTEEQSNWAMAFKKEAAVKLLRELEYLYEHFDEIVPIQAFERPAEMIIRDATYLLARWSVHDQDIRAKTKLFLQKAKNIQVFKVAGELASRGARMILADEAEQVLIPRYQKTNEPGQEILLQMISERELSLPVERFLLKLFFEEPTPEGSLRAFRHLSDLGWPQKKLKNQLYSTAHTQAWPFAMTPHPYRELFKLDEPAPVYWQSFSERLHWLASALEKSHQTLLEQNAQAIETTQTQIATLLVRQRGCHEILDKHSEKND